MRGRATDVRHADEPAPTDLVWGKRTVLEHLRRGSPIQRIYVTPEGAGMGREFFELAKELSIPVVRSDRERLDSLTRRGNHQGIVATLGERSFAAWQDVVQKALAGESATLVLALDGVQDPGNFGAILRTAEGAGVQGVVVAAAGSCPLSATVSKTSAGADAYVPVARVEKLDRALQQLKDEGLQVVVTDPQAPDPYWAVDWTLPSVLVLGAEGEGVSRSVSKVSSLKVSIPMRGQIQSLNVSASAAAVLYEVVRQRGEM